jgi:hypothetical protein
MPIFQRIGFIYSTIERYFNWLPPIKPWDFGKGWKKGDQESP